MPLVKNSIWMNDMWNGPNSDEMKCLKLWDGDIQSVIIRFDTDGTHKIIWRWNEDRWISEEGNK